MPGKAWDIVEGTSAVIRAQAHSFLLISFHDLLISIDSGALAREARQRSTMGKKTK